MKQVSPYLCSLEDSHSHTKFGFYCLGCKSLHLLRIRPAPSPSWEFNGNLDRPTFRPSVLINLPGDEDFPTEVCHSFVTDGSIQYLSDSTHEFSGQTILLPELPDYYKS